MLKCVTLVYHGRENSTEEDDIHNDDIHNDTTLPNSK